MVRTRQQERRKVMPKNPPPAGWRVQEPTDDESEFDPNEHVDNEEIGDDNIYGQDGQDEEFDDEEEGIDFDQLIPECAHAGGQVRPQSQDTDETDSRTGKNRTLMLIIMITLICGSVYGIYNFPKETSFLIFELQETTSDFLNNLVRKLSQSEPVKPTFDTLTPWEKFKEKFKTEFTPKYLNAVPKSSIKVIKAAVKEVMMAYEDMDKIDSLSPSVILILGKEGNQNVTCFSRDLERIIASSYNEGNPTRLKGDSVDSRDIEAAFKEVFEDKRQHLIVIDGLNKLDGKSAAHLHRYTDHGQSKFKEAIIILLGYTDQVAHLKLESSMKEMDSVASDLIMKLWAQTLPGDTIAPLISRLTPSVTAVLDWDGQITIC